MPKNLLIACLLSTTAALTFAQTSVVASSRSNLTAPAAEIAKPAAKKHAPKKQASKLQRSKKKPAKAAAAAGK
jgi:hypothetical protein